jgi:phosphatidylserine/phosphatidylglycerophosphate/cardiolipin synthase-like enzyme
MSSPGRWGFHQWDDRLGDGIEAILRAHHRRRLRRLGWAQALDPADDGSCWSTVATLHPGNAVDVLIDGTAAFAAMAEAIRGATESVHIANWHASPDFRLTREAGSPTLRDLLAAKAERLPVRLLLWAGPPVPAFQPTRRMVRQARDEFTDGSAIRCELDSRERTMHCHHEKIVVVDGVEAFVGGLDFTALQGDRHDDGDHAPRDALRWHDAAVRLRGPAVVDVARHFCERWSEVAEEHLPPPSEPPAAGDIEVQVVRTVPEKTYRFAPRGDFTALEAYLRALRSAERFIYLENQFLWSPEITDVLADKLERPPCDDFRILLVLPTKPTDGRDTTRGQLGRLLDADEGGRLLATTVLGPPRENTEPVYVHAKIGIVDDRWLTIGSVNLNEHSLFNDSEMNVVTCDPGVARDTRLRLWSEHTERPQNQLSGDPRAVIDEIWEPIAREQAQRRDRGLRATHRVALLPRVSRRVDRLEGPIRGLLVDG